MIKLSEMDYNILCESVHIAKHQTMKAMVNGDIECCDINLQLELIRKLKNIQEQLEAHKGKKIINIGIK